MKLKHNKLHMDQVFETMQNLPRSLVVALSKSSSFEVVENKICKTCYLVHI